MGVKSDADIVDGASDFRLMKRSMVDAIIEISEQNRFSKGIFGWIGFKTKWLPFENVEIAAGETKWNFWSLFKYSLDAIFNFSQAPLQIASLMGINRKGVTKMSFELNIRLNIIKHILYIIQKAVKNTKIS